MKIAIQHISVGLAHTHPNYLPSIIMLTRFFTAFVTLSSERILGMWLGNFSCEIQKLNCLLESSLE